MKIPKKILREIYAIQSGVQNAKNIYLNDRDPMRADKLLRVLKETSDRCLEIINSQDPL